MMIKCPYCNKWNSKENTIDHLQTEHELLYDTKNINLERLLKSWNTIGMLEVSDIKNPQ